MGLGFEPALRQLASPLLGVAPQQGAQSPTCGQFSSTVQDRF